MSTLHVAILLVVKFVQEVEQTEEDVVNCKSIRRASGGAQGLTGKHYKSYCIPIRNFVSLYVFGMHVLCKCIRWTKVSSTIQHSIWCAY